MVLVGFVKRLVLCGGVVLWGIVIMGMCGCNGYEKRHLPLPTVKPVSGLFGPGHKIVPIAGKVDETVEDIGFLARLDGIKIIVDPGHGGRDPGTLGGVWSRLPEKDIVLMIGNELAELLDRCGATVISTRTTDRFIELDRRAELADRKKVDLLVSVHADAIADSGISGATVYVARKARHESIKVAKSICRAFRQAGIICRGMRRADFRVLAKHTRPAVLVECGYMTNYNDSAALHTKAYRSKVAMVIAKGIASGLIQKW